MKNSENFTAGPQNGVVFIIGSQNDNCTRSIYARSCDGETTAANAAVLYCCAVDYRFLPSQPVPQVGVDVDGAVVGGEPKVHGDALGAQLDAIGVALVLVPLAQHTSGVGVGHRSHAGA